jgi:hypothetical protein
VTAPRTTGELVDAIVETTTVKSGRRKIDWRSVFSLRTEASVFFWIFGMILDERHKPSMSRIMLALWTIAGWQLIRHEILLVAGQPAISNATWQAWWAGEGMLSFAVFGPSIASYFVSGAAGAISASSIASAVRDAVQMIPGVAAPPPPPPPPVTTTTTTTTGGDKP